MGKSIFGKMSDYINDKVGYHLSSQEEYVKQLLEEILKDKSTLKYTLPSTYFVSNERLKTRINVGLNAVHVLVGGQLLMIACNSQASYKFRQMVQSSAEKDVAALEETLKSESNIFSERLIKKIQEEIGNENQNDE